jgi:hypothetical protein
MTAVDSLCSPGVTGAVDAVDAVVEVARVFGDAAVAGCAAV